MALSEIWAFISRHRWIQPLLYAGISASVPLLWGLYNAFLHPLRHYPGPLLWRAYRFPWVLATHKGEIHRKLKEFHDRYGPVVRVAPDELSYIDGRAWKEIYSTRSGHLPFARRAPFTNPNGPTAITSGAGPDHLRLRRAFSNSFSEKSLRYQATVVEGYVESLATQLHQRAVSKGDDKPAPVDLVQWITYVAFDISGDLSFGESFDCIQNGKAHPWVEITHDFGKGLSFIGTVNMYPPLNKLMAYMVPKKLHQRRMEHQAISYAKTRKRLAQDLDRLDFVTPAKKYSEEKEAITPGEWDVNMSILIFAGSETTASGLSGIFRYLLQNPATMDKLKAEIRGTFAKGSDITVASTIRLPYLMAVIEEGLRVAPPVVTGLPRIAPKGGDIVCGQFVPEGTKATIHQWAAYRSERNFKDPSSFNPERWIKSDSADDMTIFQPFGTGASRCLGVQLAYNEMRIILARLVYEFDMALADENDVWDWGEQETYIFWEKKPLNVILSRSTA